MQGPVRACNWNPSVTKHDLASEVLTPVLLNDSRAFTERSGRPLVAACSTGAPMSWRKPPWRIPSALSILGTKGVSLASEVSYVFYSGQTIKCLAVCGDRLCDTDTHSYSLSKLALRPATWSGVTVAEARAARRGKRARTENIVR